MLRPDTPLKFNIEPENDAFQKRDLLFQGAIFRFYVKLQGCTSRYIWPFWPPWNETPGEVQPSVRMFWRSVAEQIRSVPRSDKLAPKNIPWKKKRISCPTLRMKTQQFYHIFFVFLDLFLCVFVVAPSNQTVETDQDLPARLRAAVSLAPSPGAALRAAAKVLQAQQRFRAVRQAWWGRWWEMGTTRVAGEWWETQICF